MKRNGKQQNKATALTISQSMRAVLFTLLTTVLTLTACNENIPVSEGSIIRVAPEGKRAIKNTGSEEMLMLCVQYKGNTFTAEDAADGVILNDELKW